MTAAEASSTIGAAKLQVGSVTYSGGPVAGVADGSVASQSPVKGTMVAPSSKVDLTLAGVESVFVPAIEGESQTQALIDLKSAGLVAGTITTVTTGGVSPNMVIAQSPVSGATVDKGSAVDLQVSQNQASVPDVVGVTRADAEASLENVGFVVSVTQRSSTSVASGRVIEQNPTAGVTA
jgi:serine/threonine-protein kinase